MEKPATNLQTIDGNNEVHVASDVTLASYNDFITPDQKERIAALTEKLKGKRISFFNSTPYGGGVAIIRHDLLPFLRHLGIDAHWYVLIPDTKIFSITKRKFHDILQGVAADTEALTAAEEKIYNAWSAQNAQFFQKAFASSDIIVIDDMQPSGLIPHIKDHNKAAKIVYRSHIQIDTSHLKDQRSSASKTWQFLWKNISLADVFVSHPVPDFVPKNVPKEKVIFMPPFVDPLNDLNQELSDKAIAEKMRLFNTILKDNHRSPLDLRRPYIAQIARFDPSKGIPDVLEAYKLLSIKLKAAGRPCPQLVIVGSSSVDDPEGSVVLNRTLESVDSRVFDGLRDDIKIAMLPPDDLLLNAILRKAKIALQLSVREGFEFKVTEALMKSKPVVAFRAGGIPLQIKDGVNGFLAAAGDVDKVAEYLYDLLTDPKKYKTASEAALEYYDRSILIVPCAIHWMEVWTKLLNKD